jgi:hypothetical protein
MLTYHNHRGIRDKGKVMPPFRTVHAGRAGPSALGILVPPGNRTVVVVRPRALPVDLVMVRPATNGASGASFFEAGRQAAGLEAQRLAQALVQGAAGSTGVVVIGAENACHVRAEVGTFHFVACERLPGQAYRPHVYATLDDAKRAADELEAVLFPGPDAERELYTNMSQFGRAHSPSPLGGEGLG